MERIAANGAEFEVQTSGSGEPVLLIHGALIGADAYAALAGEDALSEYRLIRYNRRGYCGSTALNGPFSIADQARDAAAILRKLGIDRAHVAGHSFGALVALLLAHDEPNLVHSLVLAEPPLNAVPSAAAFGEAVTPVFQAYESGDRAGAVDMFCRMVAGDDYRERMRLPGAWFDQAVADLDGVLTVEFPSEEEWQLDGDFASRIRQPVLSVVGADSEVLFVESHQLVRELLPQARELVVPGCTHGLQIISPHDVAVGLAQFFATCPLPVGATNAGAQG